MSGCLQECRTTRLLPQRTGFFFSMLLRQFRASRSLIVGLLLLKRLVLFVIVTLHLTCILVTVASGTKALRQPPLSVFFFTSDVSNVYVFVVILFTLSAQGLEM